MEKAKIYVYGICFNATQHVKMPQLPLDISSKCVFSTKGKNAFCYCSYATDAADRAWFEMHQT